MRILVAGGTGFIGSHACVSMLCKGHSVLIYDNFSNCTEEVVSKIKMLKNGSIDYIKGDINHKSDLLNAFDVFRPNVVVHFAGLKSVKESTEDPLKYYQTNVHGTLNILECMDVYGCSHIVFSSSATVYGTPKYLPFDEQHPIAPVNPYGETKAICENILRDWVFSHNTKSAVCLRYFNPIGAHESGIIGENPSGTPGNLMPFILQVAKGHREYLTIFGDDYDTRDGTGERDYVHVMDIADAHVEAIQYSNLAKKCSIFNLGTGEGTTVKELVKQFELTTGVKIPYQIEERRPGDVGRSWASTDHAKACLGISTHRSLENMCRDSWNWVKNNPNSFK